MPTNVLICRKGLCCVCFLQHMRVTNGSTRAGGNIPEITFLSTSESTHRRLICACFVVTCQRFSLLLCNTVWLNKATARNLLIKKRYLARYDVCPRRPSSDTVAPGLSSEPIRAGFSLSLDRRSAARLQPAYKKPGRRA